MIDTESTDLVPELLSLLADADPEAADHHAAMWIASRDLLGGQRPTAEAMRRWARNNHLAWQCLASVIAFGHLLDDRAAMPPSVKRWLLVYATARRRLSEAAS